jgi:hypothetical protein
MEHARPDLQDTIKRPNLQIMGMEKEVQSKDIENIFNKRITEKFPNLDKEMVIEAQEAFRIPNRQDKNLSKAYYS